ncbi:MAG: hypothetical protein R3F48_00215 [Candidatus Zixiibacteriota bacterium]
MEKTGAMKYPVIIPSSVDDSGIHPDIFTAGNFNLLPLVHKSIIQYLVDDIRKDEFRNSIGDIYLVINADLDECYTKQFKDRNDIKIILEDSRRLRGILASVNRGRQEIDKVDERDRPFIIFYGDTLIHDLVLKHVMIEAEKLRIQEKEGGEGNWCVVVFIRDIEGLLKKKFEKNRWGHVIVNKNFIERAKRDDKNGMPPIWILDGQDIKDVLYRPTYPDLLEKSYMQRRFKIDPSENNCDGDWKDYNEVLVETGALVFSTSLWNKFTRHQEKRDPLGLKSVPFSARRLLIDDPFKVVGVVTDASAWLDVNYPWEYLHANDCLGRRLARKPRTSHTSNNVDNKTNQPRDLKDTKFILVRSIKELINLFQKSKGNKLHRTDDTPDTRGHNFTHEYDSLDDWGISDSVEISGTLVIPDPTAQDDVLLYIGSNVTIEGNCVIRNKSRIRANAVLNNANIGDNCLIDCHCNIDHSVVMENVKILSGAAIAYSVIGKGSVIGGKTIIACEKLIAIGKKENGTDYSPSEIDSEYAYSDPDLVYRQMSKYHASSTIVRHRNRFGALVGDFVRIGANSFVQPGRKIGHHSIITPGTEIRHNIPPFSEVTSSKSDDF